MFYRSSVSFLCKTALRAGSRFPVTHPQSGKRLLSQATVNGASNNGNDFTTKVVRFSLTALTIYVAGSYVQFCYEEYNSLIVGTKIRFAITDEELAACRAQCQQYLQKRGSLENVKDTEFSHILGPFYARAMKRIKHASQEELEELESKAAWEVHRWYKQRFSTDPAAVRGNLGVRYFNLYSEEEMDVIARSPSCLSALDKGRVLTSAEVRGLAARDHKDA